jgi:hypothetical protein
MWLYVYTLRHFFYYKHIKQNKIRNDKIIEKININLKTDVEIEYRTLGVFYLELNPYMEGYILIKIYLRIFFGESFYFFNRVSSVS